MGSEPVNHWEDCQDELSDAGGGRQADEVKAVADCVDLSRFGAPPDDFDFDAAIKQAALEGQNELRRERAMLAINRCVPAKYRGDNVSLDTYEASEPGQTRALNIARKYVDTFGERLADGTGLVLYGYPGTGKTHLGCSIAKALIHRGASVHYTSVIKAMRQFRETYRSDSPLTEKQVLASFMSPDLLILDEVGVQHNSDAEKVKLFEIVDGRYCLDKPIILISNLGEQGMIECMTEKVWDRIREKCVLVAFQWTSHRRRR